MPACPFCKAQVGSDLLRYGGHCPKCMIAIPGEETPTDPGERAKVLQELEEQAAKSKYRGAFMAAAATMGILLGGGGAYWYQNREVPAPVVAGNIEDEIYIVPLTAHRDLVLKSDEGKKNVEPRTDHAAPAKKQVAAAGRDVAIASKPATGGTVAEPQLAPIEGSLGGFDAPLGGLGPNVHRADIEGIVLSDPTEINTMVKRVMSKGQGQLRQCYESRLKADEGLKGAWNVQFQIDPTGHATSVAVVAVDSPDSELESCIERNIVGVGLPEDQRAARGAEGVPIRARGVDRDVVGRGARPGTTFPEGGVSHSSPTPLRARTDRDRRFSARRARATGRAAPSRGGTLRR